MTWLKTESYGKAELELVKYKGEGDESPKWVTFPENTSAYEGNSSKTRRDLDELIEYPDDWEIVFIALIKGEEVIGASNCSNGNIVDEDNEADQGQGANKGQKINIIILDSDISTRADNTVYVTIHEMLHALGLPDLYEKNPEKNEDKTWSERNYGWSMMSSCWHASTLTGYEKMRLGWLKLEEYIFLKRGQVMPELYAQASSKSKKGVVVLPNDSVRPATYFMEINTAVGYDNAKMAVYSSYGLLMMMIHKERKMIPFVYERPLSKSGDYGGASKAALLTKGNELSTNGIKAHLVDEYDATEQKLSALITVESDFKYTDEGTLLREKEQLKIADGEETLALDTFGILRLDGIPCFYDGDPMTYNDGKKDYGFCAYVTDKGEFNIARATNSTPDDKAIIKTLKPPTGVELETGNYFMKIEKDDTDKPQVSIYQRSKDGETPVFQYVLFKHYQTIEPGWEKLDGSFKIQNRTSSNGVVVRKSSYKMGSRQVYGNEKGRGEITIVISENGTTRWFSHSKKAFIKTFKGEQGEGPFDLSIANKQDNSWDLVLQDKNQTTLHYIYRYLETGWEMTEEGYAVAIRDRKLIISKGETVVFSSKEVYGKDFEFDIITFNDEGEMKWMTSWDNHYTVKTFLGKTGTAPFSLSIDNITAHGFDLVVKDNTGKVLYQVFGYLEVNGKQYLLKNNTFFELDGMRKIKEDVSSIDVEEGEVVVVSEDDEKLYYFGNNTVDDEDTWSEYPPVTIGNAKYILHTSPKQDRIYCHRADDPAENWSWLLINTFQEVEAQDADGASGTDFFTAEKDEKEEFLIFRTAEKKWKFPIHKFNGRDGEINKVIACGGRQYALIYSSGAYVGHDIYDITTPDQAVHIGEYGSELMCERDALKAYRMGCNWYIYGGEPMVWNIDRDRFVRPDLSDPY